MEPALVDQASEQFLGQWKRLVSTTNWEKGRIIGQWREALRAADAAASEYSDDAWSRRVGNVTPQHVGRLRRVYERFGDVRDDYGGLFWSHFQAALDWDDAELWLEGAVQNGWSISEMRYKRWETTGAVADEEPADDAPDVPWDDDSEGAGEAAEVTTGTLEVVSDVAGGDVAGSDEAGGDRDGEPLDESAEDASVAFEASQPRGAAQSVAPFASLPPLPADVNDAFEAYKLCILRHKLAGWREISRDELVFSLEALVQLALAPAEA